SIPTFILMINGREVARRVGKMTEADLRRMCARIPEPAADPQVLLADNSPQSRSEAAQTLELVQTEEQPKSNPILDLFRGKRGKDAMAARGNDDQLASAAVAHVSTDDPMAASVRIRAQINGQTSLGSGTIVHSQPGRTLIITCGHIFRDHNDTTKVEVDLFEGGKAETYVATIIDTDLEADVGVISIPTHSVVSNTPLAPPSLQLARGEQVQCIGCSSGNNPTSQPLQITEVNKYDGPDNIECTGTPVQGRSGGGLFNSNHQLVGVCIAAVTDAPLGVYAHVFAVHSLLERNGLSRLYQPTPPLENAFADSGSSDAPPADFPDQPEAVSLVDEAAALAATQESFAAAAAAVASSETATDLASVMADVSAGVDRG
ncbi:MAG: trypsin-like peptidase domain-containing protein, partial [Pirellulales bacterium]